jgi:uncharacterized membrane protein
MRLPNILTWHGALSWGLIVQALFYVMLGINHFWHWQTYVAIMPTHYFHPRLLVFISGAAEILGGLGLLLEKTRRIAAWGLIAMLLIYFDVHFFMVSHPSRFASIPVWLLYLRIPFQFALVAWAWAYTRPAATDK